MPWQCNDRWCLRCQQGFSPEVPVWRNCDASTVLMYHIFSQPPIRDLPKGPQISEVCPGRYTVACTVYLGCEIHLSDGPARQPKQTKCLFLRQAPSAGDDLIVFLSYPWMSPSLASGQRGARHWKSLCHTPLRVQPSAWPLGGAVPGEGVRMISRWVLYHDIPALWGSTRRSSDIPDLHC